MTDINSIVTIVSAVAGCGGVTWLLNWRNNKRISNAQASTTEWELYDKRIAELHQTVSHLNATEREQAERIRDLNKALNDKTDRIRKYTDQLYGSEQALNRANATITNLTAEVGRLRLDLEKYRNWHCRKSDCTGRIPPNPTLQNLTWEDTKTDTWEDTKTDTKNKTEDR